ncbi:MAG TPA: hypothetical protein VLV30_01245 [Methanomicrobiales archaeon]|nr:hypothetical protein [Methanomicrobiales archaeon]
MPHDACPNCGAALTFREADICWKCGFRIKPLPEGAEEGDRWAIGIAAGLFVAPLLIAAIIAAIVFGMASGVERTKTVAATARQEGNDIYVTWQGGRDNALVTSYTVSLGGSVPTAGFPPLIGNTTRIGNGTAGPDHVVVMASFTDGSRQVVLDTYV